MLLVWLSGLFITHHVAKLDVVNFFIVGLINYQQNEQLGEGTSIQIFTANRFSQYVKEVLLIVLNLLVFLDLIS